MGYQEMRNADVENGEKRLQRLVLTQGGGSDDICYRML